MAVDDQGVVRGVPRSLAANAGGNSRGSRSDVAWAIVARGRAPFAFQGGT
jgi:hypothetical protein